MADRTETASAGDGETTFLAHLARIERITSFVCARHHLSGADADDFASHVKLKLLEDDYAILRSFQGRSNLSTYLTVVIQRLFVDYRRSAWGKWRPSAEAVRSGRLAVLLEQLIVRDGHSFDEACEILRTNHAVDVPRAELERLAARLPVRSRRRFEDDASLMNVPSPDVAEAALASHEQQAMADRLAAALREAKSRFEVQDQLIIAMRFDDGRTVAEIAVMLQLDQKQLYRRLDRLLRELRTSLEGAGVRAEDVAEILEEPSVNIEWGERKGEQEEASASIQGRAKPWR